MPGSDRFILELREHASGGFAKVIKGRDQVLERDVAVKVLNPLATEFPEAQQERFRREARVLAKLSHPNVPSIYDVEFSDKTFQIIFQFIEGKTLRQMIEEEGPCQVSEALLWFRQVASALEHAHGLDIIHRDIKPENIIVTPDRSAAYLVDFGIALTVEDARKLTKSGYVIGTPGYMSPEQQTGSEMDHRSDLYSLGVTLYEVLAGKPIPVGEYKPLSATNEAIAPALDDLIEACLRPRETRIATAKEFMTQLAGASRTTRPLAEILAHGRLHELDAALSEFTAGDFASLPAGQRALVFEKLMDIVQSDDPNLRFPSERFLTILLRLGLETAEDEYRMVVVPAVHWGFGDGCHDGNHKLRRALEEAAHAARGPAFRVLEEEFLAYLGKEDLNAREDWYLGGARVLLQTLLANPACSKPKELAGHFREINSITRLRGR